MPLTKEHKEAALKRKADVMAQELPPNGGSSSPQQGQPANAGTQLTVSSASASAGNPSGTPAAASNSASAKAPIALPTAPVHLLDNGQVKQVYQMNTDQVKALATAMRIDVDSKTHLRITIGWRFLCCLLPGLQWWIV